MYRLTTSVPYLLNRLGVRLGAMFQRRIAPYGLTLPMYRVLAALSEAADQRLGDLSAMTTIDLSTMSRLVGTLVKMGLVSRVRLPTDERTVRINLTSRGAQLAVKLMREAQHYEDVAISSLSAPAIAKLKADLIHIYDALDVLEGELVAMAPAAPGKSGRSRSNGRKSPAAAAGAGVNTAGAVLAKREPQPTAVRRAGRQPPG